MGATEDSDVRVELAVRSLGPGGTKRGQDDLIERLRELERRGDVASFSVSVWGKRVGLDGVSARTDPGAEILSTVESFREWADRNDLSIGTFFETTRVRSELTGENYRALELPTASLAEYEDGELRWVTPCLDPDTGAAYTVRNRIETLASSDEAASPAREPLAMTPVAEE